MQDGAPPYWALRVREWLDEKFSNRWIGRGEPGDSNISWVPRFLDLTPMIFFRLELCHGKCLRKEQREFDLFEGHHHPSIPGIDEEYDIIFIKECGGTVEKSI